MSTRHRSRAVTGLLAVAALLATAAVYFGAYAALVHAGPIGTHGPPPVRVEFQPHYRWGGRISETLFAPAHAVDRWLWPERWVYEPGAA